MIIPILRQAYAINHVKAFSIHGHDLNTYIPSQE